MLLDPGDSFRPGACALVWNSGGILSFRFGESDEGVLQFLFEGGAGHKGKVITREGVSACAYEGALVQCYRWSFSSMPKACIISTSSAV